VWLLSFIPDSILHLAVLGILFSGIAFYICSFFVKFIPPFIPYAGGIRVFGTLLLIAGVYFYGSYDTEMSWRKKVEEVQAKVVKAEAESKVYNQKLTEERKKKQKVRVEYYTTVKERIKEVEKQIDAKCELDPAVSQIHNTAASNPTKKETK
jgi:Tfp pilus assembly protein PilO